jgi:hypothetical protein
LHERTSGYEKYNKEDYPGERHKRSEGDKGEACVVVTVATDVVVGVNEAGIEGVDEASADSEEHDDGNGHAE